MDGHDAERILQIMLDQGLMGFIHTSRDRDTLKQACWHSIDLRFLAIDEVFLDLHTSPTMMMDVTAAAQCGKNMSRLPAWKAHTLSLRCTDQSNSNRNSNRNSNSNNDRNQNSNSTHVLSAGPSSPSSSRRAKIRRPLSVSLAYEDDCVTAALKAFASSAGHTGLGSITQLNLVLRPADAMRLASFWLHGSIGTTLLPLLCNLRELKLVVNNGRGMHQLVNGIGDLLRVCHGSLERLALRNAILDEDVCDALGKLNGLKVLHIDFMPRCTSPSSASQIRHANLKILEGLTALEELGLPSGGVSAGSISDVTLPSVKSLRYIQTEPDDHDDIGLAISLKALCETFPNVCAVHNVSVDVLNHAPEMETTVPNVRNLVEVVKRLNDFNNDDPSWMLNVCLQEQHSLSTLSLPAGTQLRGVHTVQLIPALRKPEPPMQWLLLYADAVRGLLSALPDLQTVRIKVLGLEDKDLSKATSRAAVRHVLLNAAHHMPLGVRSLEYWVLNAEEKLALEEMGVAAELQRAAPHVHFAVVV
jgi:hypothetical protein